MAKITRKKKKRGGPPRSTVTEKQLLAALEKHGYNRGDAAAELGVSRGTTTNLIKRYGLNVPNPPPSSTTTKEITPDQITAAGEAVDWHREKMGAMLGISSTTLIRKAKMLGMDLPANRSHLSHTRYDFDVTELLTALEANGWSKSAAAASLSMSPDTLRRNIVKYRLGDFIDKVSAEAKAKQEVLAVEEEHRLRKEVRLAQGKVRELLDAAQKQEDAYNLFLKATEINLEAPQFLTPKPPKAGHKERAQVVALFSDLHFDEVVRPEEFGWANAYDRQIATARLRTYFDNLIRLCRDYISGVDIEGLTFAMLGDTMSGIIHEELRETNEEPILDGLVYWSKEIADGLAMLAEYFPQIYVPCIVGNHGRLDRKPRMKNSVRDNFEWILYHMLARYFEHNDAVTFAIPQSRDWGFNVYNKRIHLTHGDQFRGGSGINNLLPVMLGDHRKIRRELNIGEPYDYLCLGHFHIMRDLGWILMNGSMKGYDEFAATFNMAFERPRQALFLMDPEHGKVDWREVHCLAKDEWWLAKRHERLAL